MVYLRPVLLGAGLLLLLLASGCQTLREVANLRNVSFALDRVGEASLAGIDLNRVRSYEDLSAGDVLRLTQAVTRNELPLSFTLHLNAENPPENDVQARLVTMDWTLLIDEQETISGVFDDTVVLPPGEPRDVPIPMRLDLVDFFDGGAQDLIELALAIAGQNGAPKRIQLRATPTIDTAIGPIQYPRPITIASKDVGG
ncbi:MAG: hypothetical protein GVY18_06865 [Bacteroidetes bacterium]|jgi:hypothetical protein|nr:hypothetical protein [Bacteroidota bacterium]